MDDLKNMYFYNHCQKILGKMSDEEIKNVKNLKSNEARIRDLYRHALAVPINYESPGKSFEVAQMFKEKGNEFFKKGKNYGAVELYNQGILNCPQTNAQEKELLCVLIANRSAAFFDMKLYKKALQSIDYALDVGSYPKHLIHKLWARKLKTLKYIGATAEEIQNCYENAKQSLSSSNLKENERKAKLSELDATMRLKTASPKISEDCECKPPTNYIKIEENSEMGRFATAAVDIEIGTEILNETPFSSCVAPSNVTKNCQYCFKSTTGFVACENCTSAVFCDKSCKAKAQTFHQHECRILGILCGSGVSLNCLLALRMVTQNPLKFFCSEQDKIKFTLGGYHEPDDYSVVMSLCSHDDRRPLGQFVHYTCMVVFMLRLLKRTKYFEGDKEVLGSDKEISKCETLIGVKLLQHLLMLEFNAHEISECVGKDGDLKKSVTETIGAGVYLNLAFFNHSCQPSIIRYNEGKRMVVKTIVPIKSGDVIYENYGPMYTTENVLERQNYLEKRYWFTCNCTPCKENWPTLDTMKINELKIPCSNKACKFPIVVQKDSTIIELECKKCKTPNAVFSALKSLMNLEKTVEKADGLYASRDYDQAAKELYSSLKLCYENMIPPHPDIIQLNQKLRECLIHLGNHKDEPPFDNFFHVFNKY